MAIAQLAGGQWPGLITTAIEAAVVEEQRPNPVMRLLRSILRAFDMQAEMDAATIKQAIASQDARRAYIDRADNALRLTSPTLIRYLVSEEDEEWGTANRGRSITPYFLRHQLRHLLKPKGAIDWWTVSAGNRRHHSGYTRAQFADAWSAILPGEVTGNEAIASLHTLSQGSGASGVSGADGQNPRPDEPGQSHEPDEGKSDGAASGAENRRNPPAAPDAPDAPDHQERMAGKVHAAAGPGHGTPNGVSVQPTERRNDASLKSGRPPSSAVQAVRDLRVEHPEWSTAKLARSLGVVEAKVIRALQGWEPPTSPPADTAEAP
jgi:hypothetical protein